MQWFISKASAFMISNALYVSFIVLFYVLKIVIESLVNFSIHLFYSLTQEFQVGISVKFLSVLMTGIFIVFKYGS